MELDAFTSRWGESQGRIVDASGEVRFVLGDDVAGWFAELNVGDHVDVTQTVDVTGVALVRVSGVLRAPKSLPLGFAWEASVVVDAVKRASVRCAAGRARTIRDLAANVSKLAGAHDVGVRLELVAM